MHEFARTNNKGRHNVNAPYNRTHKVLRVNNWRKRNGDGNRAIMACPSGPAPLPLALWTQKKKAHTLAQWLCVRVCVCVCVCQYVYMGGQERVSLDSIRHETAQRYWKDIDYATIVGKCCLSGHV